MIYTKRSDVQDNNNYVDKYGKITHICPECGNLYSNGIKLTVDCTISCESSYELQSYKIESVVINKTCSCGSQTIQIDNALGRIVQTLIEKGYKFISGCEGHIYTKDGIPCFAFAELTIEGKIKPYVPKCYNDKFDFEYENGKTKISCGNIERIMCLCSNKFKVYKEYILQHLEGLVNALPDHKDIINELNKCIHDCEACDNVSNCYC